MSYFLSFVDSLSDLVAAKRELSEAAAKVECDRGYFLHELQARVERCERAAKMDFTLAVSEVIGSEAR